MSDGEGLRHLALTGAGLARLAEFTVRGDVRAGRLVPVLEDLNPGDLEEIHAVFLGQGGALPARVRAVLDFLARYARVTPEPDMRNDAGPGPGTKRSSINMRSPEQDEDACLRPSRSGGSTAFHGDQRFGATSAKSAP